MQNTLVHIHKDISLPFYIYLYLCTALSLLKWYPVVDFFFQFYFSTLLTLITKGLDKELLSPPSLNAYSIFTVFTTLHFKIMWGLRLREGGTKVVWEGGVLVKLPLKTFFFLIILIQKWKQMPFFPISLSLPSVQPRGDSTSTRKSTLQGK